MIGKTGSNEDGKVKNIYDLPGLYMEWTMEKTIWHDSIGDFEARTARGENNTYTSGAVLRYPDMVGQNYRFRPALYIK